MSYNDLCTFTRNLNSEDLSLQSILLISSLNLVINDFVGVGLAIGALMHLSSMQSSLVFIMLFGTCLKEVIVNIAHILSFFNNMPLPSLLIKGNLVADKYVKQSVANPDLILPLDYIMNFISNRIPDGFKSKPKIKPTSYGDKLILIKAGTASGKSTTIPPTLFLRFFDRLKKSICVSQPRVLNAISIPLDIINIPGYEEFKIEKNIGFLTGDFKRPPNEKGITFMTVGILLNQLINMTAEEISLRYSFIVLDEIHERSADMDTLLFLIKKFLQENWKNDDCPLILAMSATFEPDLFFKYFNCPKHHFIEVKGISFPITTHYSKFDVMDIKSFAVQKAIELHENNQDDFKHTVKDIIIFVHSNELGKEITSKLHAYNYQLYKSTNKNYIAPIQLTREINRIGSKEYMDTFSLIDIIRMHVVDENGQILTSVKPIRRIIVSSPIAEVGLTIETLKYCIDTGFIISAEFNPEFACSMTLAKNITKGIALQRKGRVGRKAPGVWYPCYTEETFNHLPQDQFSEMLTRDVTDRMLNILCKESEVMIDHIDTSSHKYKKMIKDAFYINKLYDNKPQIIKHLKKIDFAQIDFFESPGATMLEFSMEKLSGLGMIDKFYNPTLFGYFANKFRKLSVEAIRMILSGYCWGANIPDLITIAAFVSVEYRNICTKQYQLRNPVKVKLDEEVLLHTRVLFADEFVDSLFLWEEFLKVLENMNKAIVKQSFYVTKITSKTKTRISTVEDWCVQNNVKYTGLLAVAQLRDDVFTSMLKMGLNPYYNGLELERGKYNLSNIVKTNIANGVSELIKIKRCIMEGFRFNLLRWSEEDKCYQRVWKTYPVLVKSALTKPIMEQQSKPLYLIAAAIHLTKGFSKNKPFEFRAEAPISILDGFIDIDKRFLWN